MWSYARLHLGQKYLILMNISLQVLVVTNHPDIPLITYHSSLAHIFITANKLYYVYLMILEELTNVV